MSTCYLEQSPASLLFIFHRRPSSLIFSQCAIRNRAALLLVLKDVVLGSVFARTWLIERKKVDKSVRATLMAGMF